MQMAHLSLLLFTTTMLIFSKGLSAPEGSVREKRQVPGSPGGYCCYDIRGPIWSTGGTGDSGYLESDSSEHRQKRQVPLSIGPPGPPCYCYTGPPPPSGPTRRGSPGEKGTKGDPGMAGQPGQFGPRGPPGPPGSPGGRGPPGYEGQPGSNGQRGPVGPPGQNGQRGPMGLKGERGNQGQQGSPGNPGNPGYGGRDGNPGPPGPPGRDGNRGANGATGRSGSAGRPGSTGPPGPMGPPGPPGPPGPRMLGLSAENSVDVGVNSLHSNSTLIIVVAVSLSVLVNIIVTVGILSVCRWKQNRNTEKENSMPCDSQVATPYDCQSIASSISDVSSVFPENSETTVAEPGVRS